MSKFKATEVRELWATGATEDRKVLTERFAEHPDAAAERLCELKEVTEAAARAGPSERTVLLGMITLATDEAIRFA